MRAVIVGAGIFGAATAVQLRRAGHDVVLVDPGPLPHTDAASTDISKLIRMDYGTDEVYTELMERAWDGWRDWNARWARPLCHADGIAVLTDALEPGTFEGDSWATLRSRGHTLERLDGSRFRAWRGYRDGYFNPTAGWAESGAVVAALLDEADHLGVQRVAGRARGVLDPGAGVSTEWGAVEGDVVVVAAGAWLPTLLPELADRVRPVGQPVLHFAPEDPDRWRAPHFPPWAADIGRTGWYGFPANADGILKVANHGPGIPTDPTGPREVPDEWEGRFRDFFAEHLPALEEAPLVARRLCLYADSFDGDFLIDRHPERSDVVVAGGGSGHGFKFAPLLGELVQRAVEGTAHPRFSWRDLGARRTEEARHDG